MNVIAKALRFWHTVRWLKPVQVYGRVRFRLAKPRPDLRPAPALRASSDAWVSPARREQSLVTPTQMRFLDVERDLDLHGWDDKELAKLWRYNLHYFDDLCAHGAADRVSWHRDLIARWMRECPPGKGTAWEPYPTSLRIVNWIKWIRAGNEPVPGMLDSLAAQARFLSKRLEWHLLGNHLFVNAKALVFAGLCFEGAEADGWREAGWRILRAEIPEQILADGGQFERSPMYHALAVEDMLDLLNAMRAWSGVCAPDDESSVSRRIAPMLEFLDGVTHPDGEISFFNDSAGGVAPTRSELIAYASRLEYPPVATAPGAAAGVARAREFKASGFTRLDAGDAVLIVDVGDIGPDYLPGHAHADTLSFELSVGGQRILVNSGVSQYGLGPERLRQRGTAAHNTVTLDGADSSEVWGGFRVARRARVSGASASVAPDGRSASVTGAHDGFLRLPGGAIHRREWRLSVDGRLAIADTIADSLADSHEAQGLDSRAESHWHFAPGFEVRVDADGGGLCASNRVLTVNLKAEGAEWRVTRSMYHPRFGVSEPIAKVVARFNRATTRIFIAWSPCTSSSSPTTSRLK
jgi:uncharacterized heparinase superfamily protein